MTLLSAGADAQPLVAALTMLAGAVAVVAARPRAGAMATGVAAAAAPAGLVLTPFVGGGAFARRGGQAGAGGGRRRCCVDLLGAWTTGVPAAWAVPLAGAAGVALGRVWWARRRPRAGRAVNNGAAALPVRSPLPAARVSMGR